MFKKDPLIQFAGIPVSGAAIRSCFANLASPEKKVQALERSGELIRLKRNLFIINQELTGKETDVRLCANHIYGPSYVSFQWALRYYGMIPEQVFMMTSATTKRTRFFETPIGNFNYVQVPASYFPIGVECREELGISFLMATREKALCDTILLDDFVPRQSIKSLATYLEDDLRLDMDILTELDTEVIEQCSRIGRKEQTFKNLIKIIKQ
jgi:hypothetical protein